MVGLSLTCTWGSASLNSSASKKVRKPGKSTRVEMSFGVAGLGSVCCQWPAGANICVSEAGGHSPPHQPRCAEEAKSVMDAEVKVSVEEMKGAIANHIPFDSLLGHNSSVL